MWTHSYNCVGRIFSSSMVPNFLLHYSFLILLEQREILGKLRSPLHIFQKSLSQIHMFWVSLAVRIQKQTVGQFKLMTKSLKKSAGKENQETKLGNLYAYTRVERFCLRNVYFTYSLLDLSVWFCCHYLHLINDHDFQLNMNADVEMERWFTSSSIRGKFSY